MRGNGPEEASWRALAPGVAVALLAALLLRMLFLWFHPRFTGDTLVYGDLAQNLLRHHVYGLTENVVRPTLIRLPGYPLFLACCFAVFGDGRYLPVLWVQVGMDLLSCWLLGELAAQLFGPRAGRVALWLAALCPFTANYAAAALTETPSLFCVVLALWGLGRWLRVLRAQCSWGRSLGWAAVIGAAITGAAVLRPDGGLLAAAVVPPMLWAGRSRVRRRGAVVGAALASALLCLALGAWAARNWHVFHVFEPLAPKYANDPGEDAPLGFARWYRTWATGFGDTVRVYWVYDGSTMKLSDLPPWALDGPAQRDQTAALYAQYNDGTSATPAIDAAFARLGAERIRTHPLRYYAMLPAARLGDMWLRPRTELMKLPLDWWRVRLHPRRSLFQIGYAALNFALLCVAALGWIRWRRGGWFGYGEVAFAATAFVLLRSAMLLTIDNSEPRYTLECFPVLLLLASLALTRGKLSGGLR